MESIAKAIAVVGLAAVSAYLYINSAGIAGTGWAFLAVLILVFT